MTRLRVTLALLMAPTMRRWALAYLFGRYPLAEWEIDLLLRRTVAQPTMLVYGVTEPSGVRDEAECPADHWDLKQGEACYQCSAVI
jgi:hypothetical protein